MPTPPLLKSAHLFTSLAPIPHLPIVAAATHHAKKGQHYPAHYHQGVEIIIYQHGYCEWCSIKGRECIQTKPGMVLVTPTGVVHSEKALSNYSLVYLNFKDRELKQLLRGYNFDEVRTFFDTNRRLETVALNLANEMGRTQLHSVHMIELLFKEFIILFERLEDSPESSAERLVRKVEQLLEQRFSTKPKMPTIAEELNVSSSLIRLYFSQLRGYSPSAYLQNVRLKRTLELIRGSNLSLEVIADLMGYHSASHLNRHIKNATGKTPGFFRTKAEL